VPDANISFLKLDLASLASVKRAANDFRTRSDRLDILINNAGVAGLAYSTTEDGYEVHFGVNHMGHALLTKLLLPTLLKTAELPETDIRVVNVSSKGHMFAPKDSILYDASALRNSGSLVRYGHSKLANILHARELQRQYPSITATSIHPGTIVTDIYDSFTDESAFLKYVVALTKLLAPYGLLPDGYDVRKGAFTQLWAATGSRDVVRSGYYWTPFGVKSAGSTAAQRDDLAKHLWEWTESELAKFDV
jgi:NAD(P)-dependent dehydrogenase (short-subunit alcohol dehydrogenase family)